MRLIQFVLFLTIALFTLGIISFVGLYDYVKPQLPTVADLKSVRLQEPMRIYSAEGELMAEFGEKRRNPVLFENIPEQLINAFIAIEDTRYYEHQGIDPIGILRAIFVAASSGSTSQGASTITQQLARNITEIGNERSIERKIKEVFLAFDIEKNLNKQEILALYLNTIFMGQRSYGIGAAAYTYFGKSLNELTLAEMALLAGLPKAPSDYNPINSVARATDRRNIVLRRMLEENFITIDEYNQARNEPINAKYHQAKVAFSSPYITEAVRQEMYRRYGEDAYTGGFKVYTTITKKLQLAGEQALRNNILSYDMRHGYRGAVALIWDHQEGTPEENAITDYLKTVVPLADFIPAAVMDINKEENTATLLFSDGSRKILSHKGVKWARKYINERSQGPSPKRVSDVIHVGEQIWVRYYKDELWLTQEPEVNSALVSLDSNTGEVQALVGGFDFQQSKFNRATQALRQIGSNIKPFFYAAALDKGLSLATVFNDAPITSWNPSSLKSWSPKNSPNVYEGPMRLRQALGLSKNVVMVRVVRAIGVEAAADFLERFGFPEGNIDRTEAMSLGSPSFTPMQVARGYAVFANGGFLIEPYFITRVIDGEDKMVFEAKPKIACAECNIPSIYGESEKIAAIAYEEIEDMAQSEGNENILSNEEKEVEFISSENQSGGYAPRVISGEVAFLMRDALNSNVFGEPGWNGTGWRAGKVLAPRKDIGGKTGTTNSSKDAWFSGYGANIVTSVWVGFDDNRKTLGSGTAWPGDPDGISGGEAGAKTAQPAWNHYMKVALENIEEKNFPAPPGIISLSIDKYSGQLSNGGPTRKEYFIKGTEPSTYFVEELGTEIEDEASGQTQELF
ncbi:PBP1A family penicillin-binding protein [Thorsellia kenyensis]|uniref:Penicillin-binding protein 1A n=1 Tax=Thorsellia kenyensis TaxID=1549888 RepID=A0ABV6CCH7_9GAMM